MRRLESRSNTIFNTAAGWQKFAQNDADILRFAVRRNLNASMPACLRHTTATNYRNRTDGSNGTSQVDQMRRTKTRRRLSNIIATLHRAHWKLFYRDISQQEVGGFD
jgi:hypothetical protein